MIALIIRVGEMKVTEPDGDPVTITLDVNNITVDAEPFYDIKDPNDELEMARIYRYAWQWTPTIYDKGLHYINIRVSDPYGYPFDERTMIILVKENQPLVITGCK